MRVPIMRGDRQELALQGPLDVGDDPLREVRRRVARLEFPANAEEAAMPVSLRKGLLRTTARGERPGHSDRSCRSQRGLPFRCARASCRDGGSRPVPRTGWYRAPQRWHGQARSRRLLVGNDPCLVVVELGHKLSGLLAERPCPTNELRSFAGPNRAQSKGRCHRVA